jgi:hypothetical protein
MLSLQNAKDFILGRKKINVCSLTDGEICEPAAPHPLQYCALGHAAWRTIEIA